MSVEKYLFLILFYFILCGVCVFFFFFLGGFGVFFCSVFFLHCATAVEGEEICVKKEKNVREFLLRYSDGSGRKGYVGFYNSDKPWKSRRNLHYNETKIMKAGGRYVIQRACHQTQ